MFKPDHNNQPVDTRHFIVLNPRPPFVDLLLKIVGISQSEFDEINKLALSWENDPRLIEMVRLAGDASAKVPYLMDDGETTVTILETLRELAEPHLAHIKSLPESVRSTIELLLSINTVPKGCERYAIPALLEIDSIHANMVQSLHKMMSDRPLAMQYKKDNLLALRALDDHWQSLREEGNYPLPYAVVPRRPQMEFEPVYERDRLVHVYETCVIVPPPNKEMLLRFTAPILRRPLPPNLTPPPTGSADWLLREVGKVGRHFTRAILHMVKARLAAEDVPLEVKNYRLINQEAIAMWQDYVQKLP